MYLQRERSDCQYYYKRWELRDFVANVFVGDSFTKCKIQE